MNVCPTITLHAQCETNAAATARPRVVAGLSSGMSRPVTGPAPSANDRTYSSVPPTAMGAEYGCAGQVEYGTGQVEAGGVWDRGAGGWVEMGVRSSGGLAFCCTGSTQKELTATRKRRHERELGCACAGQLCDTAPAAPAG
eukprot:361808-Chlamydomonas_euryale.AAC.10